MTEQPRRTGGIRAFRVPRITVTPARPRCTSIAQFAVPVSRAAGLALGNAAFGLGLPAPPETGLVSVEGERYRVTGSEQAGDLLRGHRGSNDDIPDVDDRAGT